VNGQEHLGPARRPSSKGFVPEVPGESLDLTPTVQLAFRSVRALPGQGNEHRPGVSYQCLDGSVRRAVTYRQSVMCLL